MPTTNAHSSPSRGTKRATRTRHPLRATGSADADHPTASPTLARAVPLPGGRAVVGALLVTVAAVGVFAAYRSANDGPTTPVVVVTADLPIGHRLQATDLRIDRAELPRAAAGSAFSSVAALEGSVTLAPLRAGELVQRSAVLPPGAQAAGTREFSFAVDRERAVNGSLQQGERVDVLATYGTGEGAYTSVVARDVPVLEVDSGGKSNTIGGSGKLTITVSMANADDVLRLAHATQVAPITVIRSTRAEGTEPGTIDTYRAPGGRVDAKSPSPGGVATGGAGPSGSAPNGPAATATPTSAPTSSPAPNGTKVAG